MSLDPQAIIGAAARLDAALRRLFHPDPFAYTVHVPVQVWDDEGRRLRSVPPAAATTWAALAGPDPLHEPLNVMVEKVPGLDAVRRPLVELFNQVEQLRGVAGSATVVVQLFEEFIRQEWGHAHVPDEWDSDAINITDGEGEHWIFKCLIFFAPPNPNLLDRLIEAARTLPASVVATTAATAPRPARKKRGSDPRTDAALKLYEQLREHGTPPTDAERIVIQTTGITYQLGTLASMLRRRQRQRERAVAAEAKAA